MLIYRNRFLAIIIIGLLILSIIAYTSDHQTDAATDTDGYLTIDNSNSPFYISGSDTYENIEVKSDGKLIITNSGTLDVTILELEGGSSLEINGGSLTLTDDDTVGGEVRLNGSCQYFNLTNGAKIMMTGADGGTQLNNSYGGCARLDITVKKGTKIIDSIINLKGGSGGDYTHGTSTLGNTMDEKFVCAGGLAEISINTLNQLELKIINSSLNATGGAGGDVSTGNGLDQNGLDGIDNDGTSSSKNGATGTAGKNGGSGKNGGHIWGFVGAGGNATINLSSKNIELDRTNMFCIGGSSGLITTGNGGNGMGGAGGTANGYGPNSLTGNWGDGGDGGTGGTSGNGVLGGNGGHIRHYAGSGGKAEIMIEAEELSIQNCDFSIKGGSGNVKTGTGGYADGGGQFTLFPYSDTRPNANGGYGSPGNPMPPGTTGAGGDGSLAGDGGSGGTGGNGGRLQDLAGAGGNAAVKIIVNKVMFDNVLINCTGGFGSGRTGKGGGAEGGDGGNAIGGDGTGAYNGGSGGTGGDGGSGGTGGDGGNMIGSTAKGGSANISICADNGIFKTSLVNITGGNGQYTLGSGSNQVSGGSAGVATGGTPNGASGTAGSSGASGTAGSQGQISDHAGIAGDIIINLSIPKVTIYYNNDFIIHPGTGRELGKKNDYIPMSIPILTYPPDNFQTNSVTKPQFQWSKLYDSTTNGKLSYYELQIDDNRNFASKYDSYIGGDNNYQPSSKILDGVYYWRVRAVYSSPIGSNNGWSDVFELTIDTTEVEFYNITPDALSWCNSSQINCSINISDSTSGVKVDSIEYCISTTGPAGFSNWISAEQVIDCNDLRYSCSCSCDFTEGINNYIKWRASDLLDNGPTESSPINVKIDRTLPIINLIYPENKTAIYTDTFSIKWTMEDTLSGLSGTCRLVIADNIDFSNIVIDEDIQVSTENNQITTYTLSESLKNGRYYWYIASSDNASNYIESELRTLYLDRELPNCKIISPDPEEWITNSKPKLIWNATDSVSGSGLTNRTQLQLATAPEFNKNEIIFDEIIMSGVNDIDIRSFQYEYQLTEHLVDGIYYWRVRAQDRTLRWGIYTEPTLLKLDSVKPTCAPDRPAHNGWNTPKPWFSWHGNDATSGLSGKYLIQLSETIDFVDLIFNETVFGSKNNNQTNIIELENVTLNTTTEYYYRFSTFDNAGHCSEPTEPRSFGIDPLDPIFSNAEPSDWLNSQKVNITIHISDNISGVSAKSIQYRFSTAGKNSYGPWKNLSSIMDSTILVPRVTLELSEGRNNFIKWRARDVAGNGYVESEDHRIKIDTECVEFFDPKPKISSVQNTNKVTCSINITDWLSGVNLSTINYRTRLHGDTYFVPWQNMELNGVSKNYHCCLNISFPNGDDNYIQWRAKDIAKNGWSTSEKVRINISTDTPWLDDSDADNIPDQWEIEQGLNRSDPSDAGLDLDLDGLSNLDEYLNNTLIDNSDSDLDGLNDSSELMMYFTDPLNIDTDGDGYDDRTEISEGTDPNNDNDHPVDDNSQDNFGYLVISIVMIIIIIFVIIFMFILRRAAHDTDEDPRLDDQNKVGLQAQNKTTSVRLESPVDTIENDLGGWKFADEDNVSDSDNDNDNDSDIENDDDNENTAIENIENRSKRTLAHKTQQYIVSKPKKSSTTAATTKQQLKHNLPVKQKLGKAKSTDDLRKSKKLPKVHKIKFKQKHPHPFLHKAEKSIRCNICFGYVKNNLNIITCSCGKNYHEKCAKRVGCCPTCEVGLKSPINKIADDN